MSTGLTRVSPGIYRDAHGNTVRSTNGQVAPKKPAIPPPPTYDPTPGGPQQDQLATIGTNVNNQLNGLLQGAQNQGAFIPDPAGYADMRQKAADSVYSSFASRNDPLFAKQEADARARLASQGIDPTSERGVAELDQLSHNQSDARLQAENQAFQTGQGEQQQQFNQAQSQYEMPYQNISSLSPFYQQQQQEQFQGGQNALDRNQALQLQARDNQFKLQQIKASPHGGGGGGGGGLSLQDQMALLDRQFYNNMVLGGLQNGQQPPIPGYGSGFSQGVAGGVTAGIASGLKGGS